MIRRVLLLALLLVLPTVNADADTAERVRALAPDGLVLVVDDTGNALISHNADRAIVPASITKIVTAWLALDVLGSDYRFETEFYVDTERTLYMRGGGDPFLVSEEWALLAPKLLKATGSQPFKKLVLDTSHYPDRIIIPGIRNNDEAYNALNSALAANFNTIFAVRNRQTVRSAEKQTPITPLAIDQFIKRGPSGRGRISLAQEDPALSARYAGELLAAFIERNGSEVQGTISIGRVPANLRPIYVHQQSRPLTEIVRLMMLNSNNYIANQLFLEVGAHLRGSPVSLQKSIAVLAERLRMHRLEDHFRLVEGSGISPENRMTARGLAALLKPFAPYAGLMKATENGSFYKTGTIAGVSTLAGYARTKNRDFVRFVIALPGGTGRLRFRILSEIEHGL